MPHIRCVDASPFMGYLTLKIVNKKLNILFILGIFRFNWENKTYFLALGTIPKTRVSFIARKITANVCIYAKNKRRLSASLFFNS